MGSLDGIHIWETDDYTAYYTKIGGEPGDIGCTVEVTRLTVRVEGRVIDILHSMTPTEVGHVKVRIYRWETEGILPDGCRIG